MKGVYFGNKHSYTDWGLYLKTRPEISPPKPKTVYVSIPGSDGDLDLTESLTDDVKYENRKISCTFIVIQPKERWANIYSEILEYLHGKQMNVIMDDDPEYFYSGRLEVNQWKSDIKTSTIVIDGIVEPYKLEMFSGLEDWEWDPFDFESGIIREYGELVVDGTLSLNIEGRRKVVIPTFMVNSLDGTGMQVEFEGNTYFLPDGSSKVLNIRLAEGENTLQFTGNGTVSVDYRGGRL